MCQQHAMRYDYYYLTIQNNKTAATFCLPACLPFSASASLLMSPSRSRLLTLVEHLKNLCSLYLLFCIYIFSFFSILSLLPPCAPFVPCKAGKSQTPISWRFTFQWAIFFPSLAILDWFFHFPPFLFVFLRMSLFCFGLGIVRGQWLLWRWW